MFTSIGGLKPLEDTFTGVGEEGNTATCLVQAGFSYDCQSSWEPTG